MRIHTGLIALIAVVAVLGQDMEARTLRGRVLSEEETPLGNAAVSAYALPDTTLVNVAESNSDGHFSIFIPDSISSNCWFSIELPGFVPYFGQVPADNASLTLYRIGTDLKEFVVSARKSPIKLEAGKAIYNPSELQGRASNAVEILSMMPLVSVKQDDISILGRGTAKIYINGKPSHMPQQALMQYLRSQPFGYVKRVEVIANPGGTEMASDSRGIINIIIDDPRRGFRGSASASGSFSRGMADGSGSAWLNYSTGKFSASFSPFCSSSKYERRMKHYDDFKDAGIRRKYEVREINKNSTYGGALNVDYNFSSAFWMGAYFNISSSRYNTRNVSSGETIISSGERTPFRSCVLSDTPWTDPYIQTGLYGTWKINGYSNLEFTGNYGQRSESTTETRDYTAGTASEVTDYSVRATTANIRYNYDNPSVGTINAGYAFSDAKSTTAMPGDNTDLYETVNAFFVKYGKAFGTKISFSVGVRTEGYRRDTKWNGESHIYYKWDVYPSANFTWNLEKASQSFVLDYSSHINKPLMIFLRPNKEYTSEYSYRCGNPWLDPGKYNYLSLSYYLLDCVDMGVSYDFSSNSIRQLTISEGSNTVETFRNAGKSDCVSYRAYFTKNLTKWMRLRIGGNISYYRSNIMISETDNHNRYWDWMGDCMLFFTISQKHALSANLRYILCSPTNTISGNKIEGDNKRYYRNLTIDVSKKFGTWGDLSLFASGLTFYRKKVGRNDPSYAYTITDTYSTPDVYLRFSVYFGKRTVRSPKSIFNPDILEKLSK